MLQFYQHIYPYFDHQYTLNLEQLEDYCHLDNRLSPGIYCSLITTWLTALPAVLESIGILRVNPVLDKSASRVQWQPSRVVATRCLHGGPTCVRPKYWRITHPNHPFWPPTAGFKVLNVVICRETQHFILFSLSANTWICS